MTVDTAAVVVLIPLIKPTGKLLPESGGSFYGQSRPADSIFARSSAPVRVRFYDADGVTPVLLEAGSVLYFDCKPPKKYASRSFTLSLTITNAPTDPAVGYYQGELDTNRDEANALLNPNNLTGTTPEADEPDFVALNAQLCWKEPSQAEPGRSEAWTINLQNVLRTGLESASRPATPFSAFEKMLALYNAGFFLLNPVSCDFRYPRNSMFIAALS